MKRKQILFSVLLLFSVVATQAARVDTVMVKSPSMNKEVQVVYVPVSYTHLRAHET